MPNAINFRRDLAGKVYQLSQYSALQPVADKNFDVTKMNERFIKLHNAVRVCFDAIADLASRDTTFLPSFFQGFVNPVYVKSVTYADKSLYKLVNGFNSNGTPVSFPEERIVYSFPDIGDITTEDYEYMMFQNGVFVDQSLYTVDNSAFGVKAYIKSAYVMNNDTWTLAVHRVFNRNYQMYKKVFSGTSNGLTEIIDVPANFPNFYDSRYLRVAVRSGSDQFYDVINPSKYSIVYDSANQKVCVVIDSSIKFAQFDTMIVFDCTSFWKNTVYDTSSSSEVAPPSSIALTQTLTSGEKVPVGIMFYRDLDIWFNGRHLIPGKHFVVSPGFSGGASNNSQWYIDFLFTLPKNTSYRVDIVKNVPYIPGESTYVYKEEIDPKGVEYIDSNKFPVFSGMGEMYINGYFIDPKNITAAHKNVMLVNNVTDTNEFFFKMMPPVTNVTSSMLDEHMRRPTEFDQTVEALGGVGELIARLKVNRADIPSSDRTDLISALGGTVMPIEAVVSGDAANYVNTSFASATADFDMDANVALPDAAWDISILTTDAIIDSNVYVQNSVTLDCN
jgi:hypothetical protein